MKAQILDLIALRPNIRAVEIADKLDIDTDRVRPFIQGDIDRGLIVVEQILAPNNKMVDSFRSTVATPVVHRKPSPFPSAPLLAVTPVAAKAMTKTDAAIEYIRKNGPVPSEFLARAMGLKKGEYPSQYLSAAVKDKRLTFENKEWSVGPASVAKSALPAAATLSPPVVIPQFSAKKVPDLAPKAAPVKKPALAPVVEERAPAIISANEGVNAAHDVPETEAAEKPDSQQVMLSAQMEDWINTYAKPRLEGCVAAAAAAASANAVIEAAVVTVDAPLGGDHNPDDHNPDDHNHTHLMSVDHSYRHGLNDYPAASRFVAGLLSNGDLNIDVDGRAFTLRPDHAQALYAYLKKVGPVLLAQ